MTMVEEFVAEMKFGTADVEQRFVPDEFGLVGQRRLVERNLEGVVTRVTEWEQDGIAINAPLPFYSRYERFKMRLKHVLTR